MKKLQDSVIGASQFFFGPLKPNLVYQGAGTGRFSFPGKPDGLERTSRPNVLFSSSDPEDPSASRRVHWADKWAEGSEPVTPEGKRLMRKIKLGCAGLVLFGIASTLAGMLVPGCLAQHMLSGAFNNPAVTPSSNPYYNNPFGNNPFGGGQSTNPNTTQPNNTTPAPSSSGSTGESYKKQRERELEQKYGISFGGQK